MNLQGPRSSAAGAESERARLAAERAEADRRYNDALTALDHAIVAAGAADSLRREDLLQLATRLIVFLQQITAFVETKDRELSAVADAHIDELRPMMDTVAELRTQVSLLQRKLASQARQVDTPHHPPKHEAPGTKHPAPAAVSDVLYVGFEDHFRGPEHAIREKLRAYVDIFAGATDVVDLGCGRGEFLSALQAAGIPARGVDANAEMAAIARERGLDVEAGDALAFVTALPDSSVGGLMAAQVVEHLEPAYLIALLEAAAAKLCSGAPIVVETINPACWLAFFSSYVRDPTHVRPVHPETLQYLLRATGFDRVTIRYSAPVPEHMKMQPAQLPTDVLTSADPSARALAAIAHAFNANMAILNNLMFTHLDYAAIGYRS